MNASHNPRLSAAAAVRAELWDGGWRPVPLYSWDCAHGWVRPEHRGKRPKADAWQERARRNPLDSAETPPDADALETGILCDGLRVLDLDIDDAPTVATLRALAMALLGETIVRWRNNSPRVLLPYRAAEGQPSKRVLTGRLGKIEVLGLGQQFAAFHRHPSGAELRWLPEGPDTAALDTLPAITELELELFLSQAAPLIGAASVKGVGADRAATVTHGQPSVQGAAADPLDVVAALAVIPPDDNLDWDHWNRVGLATWAATGGSLAGLAAWSAWTQRITTRHDRDCAERWAHFARHSDRPPLAGAGTLFYLAIEARPGWRRPCLVAAEPPPPTPPQMGFLSRTRLAAPTLPLDVLGPWWGPWVDRTAIGANAPADYAAVPLLAAASALIGNARWARAWHGWFEPPALWCASVGSPSSGKSPGAAPVMREVLGIVEQDMARSFPADLKAWKEAKAVADAVGKQWEKDVAKAVKDGGDMPAKPREADIGPPPVRPRARVTDATVEALAGLLQGLPKGVLHVRDELAGWLLNLSRYSGGTDRPFWLEAYVGGPYTVDRQKHPEPLFIPRLAVPVFGTIQPDRLEDALTGTDDGLAGRFLWTWPEAHPFRRPAVSSNAPAAATALGRLAGLAMRQDEAGEDVPAYLSLDADGADLLERFGQDMQAQEAGANGLLLTSMGKARGQALRLALVLELLWWCAQHDEPEPTHISTEAMQAAAHLMRSYFLPMAARVLGDASVPAEERNARTLAEWIMRTRPAVLNVSAIRDGARLPGLRESEPVKQACRFLMDAGWLLPPVDTGQPGRPRGDWTVNPRLWQATA